VNQNPEIERKRSKGSSTKNPQVILADSTGIFYY